MATIIKLNNNSTITLSKISNDQINIEYEDSNKIIYAKIYYLVDIKELFNKKTLDEFITLVKNNKPEIMEGNNDGEMIFKIAKGQLVLKKKENNSSNGNNTTNTNDDTNNTKPTNTTNIKKSTNKDYTADSPAPLAGIDTILAEMKKKYEDKIKEAKAINEKYKQKNIELKKNIEEEKRKNDEIIRIYLINRQKYEEAVQRNTKIRELEQKI